MSARRTTPWLILLLLAALALLVWRHWSAVAAFLPGLLAFLRAQEAHIVSITTVIAAVFTVIGAVAAVVAVRHGRDRRSAAESTGVAKVSTAPPIRGPVPETTRRLHELLLGLHIWNDPRARRNFLTIALGKGHEALSHMDLDGPGIDCAISVIGVCAGRADPETGESLLCALLAAIPARFGAHPERDAEIADLGRLLGCR
jgi:hypothetical protein